MGAVRRIENEMYEWIHFRLSNNGLAQEALKNSQPRVLFYTAIQSMVGIREEGGNNNGPFVRLIQETVGSANREAWCMSLQQTGIAFVERALNVKSRIPVTEHCLTCLRDAPADLIVKHFPLIGAIIIWQHGHSEDGHTGTFLEKRTVSTFYAVEGNTEKGMNPSGKVIRDGGGVWFTTRSFYGDGTMHLKAFLKPF